jgi:hypothetical protein
LFNNFWSGSGESTVYDPSATCNQQWVNGQGGGHAVVLVGYDDTNPANPYWIILNSWGTANGLRPNGLMRWKMNMDYNCYVTDGYSTMPIVQFSTINVEFGGVTQPSVSTEPAAAITDSSATLYGTVNPRGAATTYYFQYGPTANYGSTTPVTSAGAGSSTINVNAPILGLTARSTCRCRT